MLGAAAVAALALGLWGPWRPDPAETGDANGAIVYVAAGDSLTYGYGTSAPPSTAYPALAGVSGIAQNGACVSERCPPEWSAFGWFADRLRAVPGRVDVVVALFGINDIANWGASSDEVIAGYQALEKAASAQGARVVFGTLTPISQFFDEAKRSSGLEVDQTRREVNEWIRAQPDHLDYEAAVVDDLGWLLTACGIGDGVHLSLEGEERLAAVLRYWISTGEPVWPGKS